MVHALQCRDMGIQNNWQLDYSFHSSFRLTTRKILNFNITGPLSGSPLGTGGFPSQRASNAESVSWRRSWWPQKLTNKQTKTEKITISSYRRFLQDVYTPPSCQTVIGDGGAPCGCTCRCVCHAGRDVRNNATCLQLRHRWRSDPLWCTWIKANWHTVKPLILVAPKPKT